MRIAICDDNALSVNMLRDTIDNCVQDYREIDFFSFSSGEEIVSAHTRKGLRFDMIFMDIKLKKMNGIDAAKIIRGVDDDVLIFFVTAYMDYVFQGYEARAFRYILKPYTDEQIKKEFGCAMRELFENEKRYTIQTKANILSYNIDDILYLESIKRQICIVTIHGREYFYSKLSAEEEKLAPYGFVRIHQSFLVNMSYIKTIIENSIYLTDDTVLPISKNRKREALLSYTKYLTEYGGI